MSARQDPAANAYWVVGGEYADTRFEILAEGRGEERHGPFPTYRDAFRMWRRLAWHTVDHCRVRYRIVAGDTAS